LIGIEDILVDDSLIKRVWLRVIIIERAYFLLYFFIKFCLNIAESSVFIFSKLFVWYLMGE